MIKSEYCIVTLEVDTSTLEISFRPIAEATASKNTFRIGSSTKILVFAQSSRGRHQIASFKMENKLEGIIAVLNGLGREGWELVSIHEQILAPLGHRSFFDSEQKFSSRQQSTVQDSIDSSQGKLTFKRLIQE